MNPFKVVEDFEAELCRYTGARYAVTTASCTAALMLAVAWHLRHTPDPLERILRLRVEIPSHTYVGVPMAIIHAGGWPTFRWDRWTGAYQLKPLPIWDCARRFTGGMYREIGQTFHYDQARDKYVNTPGAGHMACVSFHWSKILGIQQGGAILHDNQEADRWLRMARFDGREQGVAPKDQKQWIIGHHCYMSPEVAAAGLVRMYHMPKENPDLPNDDYPDLSQMEIFRL